MRLIRQYPHCDPRILHKPGQCAVCDKYPEWQELRERWQIGFTGQDVPRISDDPSERARTTGPVLPCPADYTRGGTYAAWAGNRPIKLIEVAVCCHCERELPINELAPLPSNPNEFWCRNSTICANLWQMRRNERRRQMTRTDVATRH